MSKCNDCFYHSNGRYGWRCGFDGTSSPNKIECNNYAKSCPKCEGKCAFIKAKWLCPRCDVLSQTWTSL